jgi:dynein assembly factor with WDR repeat domains 1
MGKLKRILLRYYPPGIILEYQVNNAFKSSHLDLLDLNEYTNIETLADEIIQQEPIIPLAKRPKLLELLEKLQSKMRQNYKYKLSKTVRAHIMPLTNCIFDKSGERFLTGSYDRLGKLWDTRTGAQLLTLEGHLNVVYALAINTPFRFQ